MGQTYSVMLKVKFTDEEGAKKALQTKLDRHEKERINYNLEHFKELGIGTDNLFDLMGIFFGGWNGKLTPDKNNERYYADFDACYGWESVMTDAFEEIAPYLADDSVIEIYPDSGCDRGIVQDSKCKWN